MIDGVLHSDRPDESVRHGKVIEDSEALFKWLSINRYGKLSEKGRRADGCRCLVAGRVKFREDGAGSC